jgi:hypothetical protein
LDISVLEWLNPVNRVWDECMPPHLELKRCTFAHQICCAASRQDDIPYESRLDAFRAFVLRANRYAALDSESTRKIVLVEDFPLVFDDERRQQFHGDSFFSFRSGTLADADRADAIRLAVRTGRYAVVLVVSGAESAAAELRALMPPDLRDAPCTAVVQCAPLAALCPRC